MLLECLRGGRGLKAELRVHAHVMAVHIRVITAPDRAVVGMDIARPLPIVLHLAGADKHRARGVLRAGIRIQGRIGMLLKIFAVGKDHRRLVVAGPRHDGGMVVQHVDHPALQPPGACLKFNGGVLHPVEFKILPDQHPQPIANLVHFRWRDMHMHPQQVEIRITRQLDIPFRPGCVHLRQVTARAYTTIRAGIQAGR
jgi:hypothetical protein